ncbi:MULTISPECIES: hypothetical protein [unclassified Streptomyces]|uniref:effector-associated constant component EACC1 n=1 Tax=unclassified Streptomyces TaxID=2593676 RepID=UPI0024823F74|nr:hypothetical protein [Streptomyces sp. ATE26]MDI1454372.1 hypothetical protein [Streptomyces sp. ATE26]
MDLTIRIDDGAGDELIRWLSVDPQTRRFAARTVPAAAEPGSGTMGTAFDVLNLVLPNAIALSSLMVSIASFRDQRRRSTGTAPTVSVDHAGNVVIVDGDSAAVVQQLRGSAGQSDT